ncbi:MAG: hypothetical protein ABSH09_18430 [Bryobacteraceae bacterium]|jgi:hypothetical protein
MDLRAFFQKIRTIAATIPGKDTVVASLETTDGGRAGELVEVARDVAAKLIAQGKARLASSDEAAQLKAAAISALKAAADAGERELVQLNVLPQADLELLRSVLQKK